jgi:hypothetical protein
MKLKSFGCSFIFGTDLADAARDHLAQPSQSTWPALLAQHLGYEYTCYARPGTGNLQILEYVLNQASLSDSSDLFIINWSWIDRFDYYDTDQNEKPWAWDNWLTIMPTDKSVTAKVYYQNLHSEYRDKFTGLNYLRLAIDTLNQKNIPFVMTYMDELLFDQKWHITPAVLYLQEYVKPYMTQFDGQTFLNWSRSKGYAESAGWHPLEQAHSAAADLIIQVVDKQNTVDRWHHV